MTKREPLQPEEMPFNMAQLYYFELHDLRKLKSEALISGNIESYKDALHEIYVQISFKLNEDKKKKIDGMFHEVDINMAPDVRGNSSMMTQIRGMSNLEAKKKLKRIDMELLDIMWKNHMLFPKIDSTSSYDKMKQRYGIK